MDDAQSGTVSPPAPDAGPDAFWAGPLERLAQTLELASPELFRSGWFVESVVSATLIVLVIRTRQPFARSRPSRALALATLAVAAVAVALPYTALAAPFGFVALPPSFLVALVLIALAYLGAAELLKRCFFGNHRKVS